MDLPLEYSNPLKKIHTKHAEDSQLLRLGGFDNLDPTSD